MKQMFKKVFLNLFLTCFCLCAFSAKAADDGAKVGWVNVDRILKDSSPAKAALNKIEQEFGKRTKDIQEQANKLKGLTDKFERDVAVMPESERSRKQRELSEMDKDLQRRQREFREDLSQRQFEERSVILERAERVIKQIAETEKYDIILQEPPVFVSTKVDITDKVIKVLNSGPGK
jgi:outer membrane protein